MKNDTPTEQPIENGTNVRKFLARKGVIILKEIRETGQIRGLYRDAVSVSAIIVATVSSDYREMTYGAKLERFDSDENLVSAAFLDYDELPELAEALNFIVDTATTTSSQHRDYTELTYETKDNACFGFYQKDEEQKAFARLESYAEMAFFPLRDISILRLLLIKTKEHLESKGASSAQL